MRSLSIKNALPQADYRRRGSLRSILAQTLKFALATTVVVYLILRGDLAWEPLQTSLSRWQYSVPAFLMLALTPLGQLWRWQSLLRAGRLRLPHREVFSYLMVSKFFNMALPGYISGDLIRGLYVSRRARTGQDSDPKNEPPGPPGVVASIVFDRVAGLLTLFALCLLGLLVSLWQPMPPLLVSVAAALAGLGLLVPLILFVIAYRSPQPPAGLLPLLQRIRLRQAFTALYQEMRHYVRDLRLMRNVLAISLLTQGLTITCFVLFGLALELEIPLVSYWILVPLGLTVVAIPISPAGLGVGQVTFLALFHTVGTAQGANLFTLYMASYGLINLSGACLFPFSRVHGPVPSATSSPHPQSAQNIGGPLL
ncbi:MAG: flippase-like domain-containing protein [Acidobacteria bacterium]|nr:flippase-like domain-containing protein [Acidobacteriota bacterium]